MLQDPDGCEARLERCPLSLVKEWWVVGNLPTIEDKSILAKMVALVTTFQKERKSVNRMKEEKKIRLREGWSKTFDIAPKNWRDVIANDDILEEEEKEEKIRVMENYVGQHATMEAVVQEESGAVLLARHNAREEQQRRVEQLMEEELREEELRVEELREEQQREEQQREEQQREEELREELRREEQERREVLGGVEDSSMEMSTGNEAEVSVATAEEEEEVNMARERKKEELKLRKKERAEGVPLFVPVNVLHLIMSVCINEGISINNIVFMLAAILIASGADLDKFDLSVTTAQRSKKRTRDKMGPESLNKYVEELKEKGEKVSFHWDEKTFVQDIGGIKEPKGRLMSNLSSPSSDVYQPIKAHELEESTAAYIVEELITQIEELDIRENIISLSFDTPSVNTGAENGVVYQLQVALGKQVFANPCQHHLRELEAKAVQLLISGRDSTAPTDPLFVRWYNSWPKIKKELDRKVATFTYNLFDFDKLGSTVASNLASSVTKWATKAKQEKTFSRGDYTNLLNLTLLVLGKKVSCSMPRPTKVSKARFLQVGLYYLQMFLLLKLKVVKELLSEVEVEEVKIMAEYVALYFVPNQLDAKFAAIGPMSLLTTISNLRQARDESGEVDAKGKPTAKNRPAVYKWTKAALEKWEEHLDMLSPELVIYSLFDELTPKKEREEMAAKLVSLKHHYRPGDRLIYERKTPQAGFCTDETKDSSTWCLGRPMLHIFTNGRSWLLWELMGHTITDLEWLSRPLHEWITFPKYMELYQVVNNIAVVNDSAERHVKLVGEVLPKVRSEEALQNQVLTKAELNRLARDINRTTFTKKQLSTNVAKMMSGERQ